MLDANENFEQWVKIDWKKIKNLHRYSDNACLALRKKLVQVYLPGFMPENIVIGSGSNELIDLLIRSLVKKGERMVLSEPTYGLYESRATLHKKVCRKIARYNNKHFLSALKKASQGAKLVVLCSPENPTGELLTGDMLNEIRKWYKGFLVIDEAYIEFAGLEKSLVSFSKRKKLLVLRTFSKAWGLAAA